MKVFTVIIALMILSFLSSYSFAGSDIIIYSEDFSSDPSWITNNSGNFYWDPVGERFHYKIIDATEEYAYYPLSLMDRSFKLTFDVLPTYTAWAGNFTCGVSDSNMSAWRATSVCGMLDFSDTGHLVSLWVYDNLGRSYCAFDPAVSFSDNVLYQISITYDTLTQDASITVIQKASGDVVWSGTISEFGPFLGMDRIFMGSMGDSGYPGCYAEGYIDNVVVTVYPEVGCEIQADFTSEYDPDDCTALLLHFDEGSGSIVYDASGNHNDGTVYGASWTSSGKFGNALSFDGDNDYVMVPNSPSLNSMSEITVEAWVYLDHYPTTGHSQLVLQKEGTYQINVVYGVPYFAVCDGDNPNYLTWYWEGASAQDPIPLHQWMHLAGTFDKVTKEIKFYVNGDLQQTKVFSSWTDWYPGHNLYIGCNQDIYNEEYFPGKIDEVRISNVVRTYVGVGPAMVISVGVHSGSSDTREHEFEDEKISPGETVGLDVTIENHMTDDIYLRYLRINGSDGEENRNFVAVDNELDFGLFESLEAGQSADYYTVDFGFEGPLRIQLVTPAAPTDDDAISFVLGYTLSWLGPIMELHGNLRHDFSYKIPAHVSLRTVASQIADGSYQTFDKNQPEYFLVEYFPVMGGRTAEVDLLDAVELGSAIGDIAILIAGGVPNPISAWLLALFHWFWDEADVVGTSTKEISYAVDVTQQDCPASDYEELVLISRRQDAINNDRFEVGKPSFAIVRFEERAIEDEDGNHFTEDFLYPVTNVSYDPVADALPYFTVSELAGSGWSTWILQEQPHDGINHGKRITTIGLVNHYEVIDDRECMVILSGFVQGILGERGATNLQVCLTHYLPRPEVPQIGALVQATGMLFDEDGDLGEASIECLMLDNSDASLRILNGTTIAFERRFDQVLYSPKSLKFAKSSPVDLLITDPSGLAISRDFNSIMGARYLVYEICPGDSGATITIPFPTRGVYSVRVIPWENASPMDSLSIRSILGPDTMWICKDVMISQIPGAGFLFNTEPYASLTGFVRDNATNGLLGVNVDVYDSTGNLWMSVVTDDSGYYHIDSIPNGNYTATVVTPLGYQADHETQEYTIHHVPVRVDFSLTKLDITPRLRSRAYWAHQLCRAFINWPKDYTLNDFSNFAGLINVHFNQNQVNPVDFYSVPQPADQADSLRILKKLLHMGNTGDWEPFLKRLAKAQLMALMLNVVSGKVHQTHEISADGRTVSQAITYCDMLVNDEIDPSDGACRYLRASFILGLANLGLIVPSGLIPEDVIEISYRIHDSESTPASFSLGQNYPNPFNPDCEIRYDLPRDVHVSLTIHNVLGQKVRTLVEQNQTAGHKTVRWDGKDDKGQEVAAEVYFYKIQAGDFTDAKKMILMK